MELARDVVTRWKIDKCVAFPKFEDVLIQYVSEAIDFYGKEQRNTALEEAACLVQSHRSYRAIDIANAIREMKEPE
jgi:hypothetical protein